MLKVVKVRHGFYLRWNGRSTGITGANGQRERIIRNETSDKDRCYYGKLWNAVTGFQLKQ